MQGFTYIDLAVLIVYLLAVLIAGLYFAKKEMKGKEYFKGDGTVPWWVTSVSIFATLLSPISFLSLPGNSYAGSWLLWFAQLGMLLAIPLTTTWRFASTARASAYWAPSCSSSIRWAVCPSSCICPAWCSLRSPTLT